MPLYSDTFDSQYYKSDRWKYLSRRIKERDNYTCRNCGISRRGAPNTIFHAHHIVPHLKGGADEESNLITLCDDCHLSLHPHMKKAQRQTYRGKIYHTESLRKYSFWVWSLGFVIALLFGYLGSLVSINIGTLTFCGGLILAFLMTLAYGYSSKQNSRDNSIESTKFNHQEKAQNRFCSTCGTLLTGNKCPNCEQTNNGERT